MSASALAALRFHTTSLMPDLIRHVAIPSPMMPSPTKPHVLPLIAPLVLVPVLVLVLGGEAGAEDMRTCATALPTSLGPRTPPPISRPVLMLARRASITSRTCSLALAQGEGGALPADDTRRPAWFHKWTESWIEHHDTWLKCLVLRLVVRGVVTMVFLA